MRLLDRYLLRELSVPLSYCLGAFLVFWISFDLFNELPDYRNAGFGAMDYLLYYGYTLPDFLLIVMPVGLLLGMLYTLTNLTRHNELVAMRAAGISLWRLSIPYFAVGILFSVFLFLLNDVLLASSAEKAQELLTRNNVKRADPKDKWIRNFNFRNEHDARTWNFSSYNTDTSEFREALMTWNLPDGTRQTIVSKTGGWENGTWLFTNALHMTFLKPGSAVPDDRVVTNRLEISYFSENPDQIRSEIKINGLSAQTLSKRVQLSLREIRYYLKMHPDLSPDRRALLLTQFHGRLAAPWTCLVAVLIALPFGATTGRRNVFVGVASSIVIFFAFYVMQKLGLALGTTGRIPAWIAAWFPNLSVAVLGIWMTWRQK